MNGNLIKLSRTNRSVSKNTFKEALNYMKLENTEPPSIFPSSAYLYAILMDDRIRKNNW
ncbi:hypothetical protein J2Z82_003666 [Virgibacillus litoralis]|uniref:Uncharacterized protein n=1 Tax=Virgibacillus litoralis TaxID=578221 RepID=A0ABS4HIE0_9BACI|nr:hypothetical protein [Virgibacillus litoralis]